MSISEMWEEVQRARTTYVVVGGAVGAVLMGFTLPERVAALERRVEVLERLAQYQGCRDWRMDREQDPADCALMFRDLESYLIPEVR